jgi:hypothetical protein
MTALPSFFERTVLAAPLGVRFMDVVTGAFVRDGLAVAAYPASNPAQRRPGFRAGSGAFAFRDLPGLRGFELAVGTDDPWTPPPVPRTFLVEATDVSGRFLPTRFAVAVPYPGLFTPGCLLADMPAAAVPLFPAAGRLSQGVSATIRAELWDAVANAPAAWALVEARMAGVLLGRGVSDAAGKVVILGPYPAVPDFAFGSPATPPLPLTSQTWPLTLAAWYEPVSPAPAIPDLCAVLRQQPATLWANRGLTAAFAGATLTFGRDLVARSTDLATGKDLPVLFITASGSPL